MAAKRTLILIQLNLFSLYELSPCDALQMTFSLRHIMAFVIVLAICIIKV